MKIAREFFENLAFFCKKNPGKSRERRFFRHGDKKRPRKNRDLLLMKRLKDHFAAGRAMTASGSKSSGQNPMGL